MIWTRNAAAAAFFALAACGAVPASNPAPQPDPILPLLSDLDLAEDAPSVTIAEPEQATSGGFLSGLLGRSGGSTPADASDTAAQPSNAVPPKTIMAFGDIAPTCGLSQRDLGTEIAKASGYAVYDTIPNSTAPRPHYITGFDDGCARQFTAALVLLGDVGTHEVVRYNKPADQFPYSVADNAYEAIKASFCRSSFGKPCGTRLERLASRTTFVTAYERFGAGPVWAEFLLHDGAVAAAGLEGQ